MLSSFEGILEGTNMTHAITFYRAMDRSRAKWRSEKVTARRAGIHGMGTARTDRTVALHQAEGRRYRLGHYST